MKFEIEVIEIKDGKIPLEEIQWKDEEVVSIDRYGDEYLLGLLHRNSNGGYDCISGNNVLTDVNYFFLVNDFWNSLIKQLPTTKGS